MAFFPTNLTPSVVQVSGNMEHKRTVKLCVFDSKLSCYCITEMFSVFPVAHQTRPVNSQRGVFFLKFWAVYERQTNSF